MSSIAAESPGHFGKSNFPLAPLLSSLISCLVACQGKKDSVVLFSQPASQSFWRKWPRVCSLEPSMTMRGGTPSCWNMTDRVSCASPFIVIG